MLQQCGYITGALVNSYFLALDPASRLDVLLYKRVDESFDFRLDRSRNRVWFVNCTKRRAAVYFLVSSARFLSHEASKSTTPVMGIRYSPNAVPSSSVVNLLKLGGSWYLAFSGKQTRGEELSNSDRRLMMIERVD